jgi:ankyrin repeat protein
VNVSDKDGFPIHRLAEGNSDGVDAVTVGTLSSGDAIACLNVLLQAGADINARNKTSRTALHLVAQRGNVQLASALLKAGANKTARDALGMTGKERL